MSKWLLLSLMVATAASIATAQVSVEEAQQHLKAKLSTRPAATQPTTEIEKLREENLRLRERLMDLQEEVTTLKAALGRASAGASGPASRPAVALDDATQKTLLGRWRGGDVAASSSYTIEFSPDSTYKQTWLFHNQTDAGQYRLLPDGVMQMWSEKAPADKRHNEYKIAVTPGELTLTPTVIDGVEVKTAKPLVLQRAG